MLRVSLFPLIRYEGINGTIYDSPVPPEDSGRYRAKITVEGQTAYDNYIIDKLQLDDKDPTDLILYPGQKLSEIKYPELENGYWQLVRGDNDRLFEYSDIGKKYSFKADLLPKDPRNYSPRNNVTLYVTVIRRHKVTVSANGNGVAKAEMYSGERKVSLDSGEEGMKVLLHADPQSGFHFKEWKVISGGVSVNGINSADASFILKRSDVDIKAIFEKDPNPNPNPNPNSNPNPNPDPNPNQNPDPDPKPGPTPKPEPSPVPVKTGPEKTVDLGGLTLGDYPLDIKLYGPKNPVSYNGRTHVALDTKLSKKQKKDKLAQEIKKINRELKKKDNRVYFSVKPLDLSEFAFDSDKSTGGKKVYTRKDLSGDFLEMTTETQNYIDPGTYTVKSRPLKVLYATLSGYEFKVPKKEYNREGGIISGRNKNLVNSPV
ncbi:MAG: hypothetical protein IJP84_08075 [Lachnospiraceae bacterium]|nr:hypothetical protein [Lachnospiraceae bacterium]